ncbi:MAG: prolipoprotein diacylglyceryl transferase [Oscillospiraceae bacterium]|nr:prolipoprotein diacylglyceryl transferase [Oscillospiraceae bacterium]
MRYTEISFPALDLVMNPGRSVSIGPLTVHYYGAIIALGLILGIAYACRRSKDFGLKEDDIIDGALWVTPFAIVCARAYYVIFRWAEEYAAKPISALYIWQGGLAIYGGVIGAVIGIIVFCKCRKIKPVVVLDVVSMGFLIGQSIGRWGNFFNREAFGAETDVLWKMGLMKANGDIIYVHPTFLYESLWNACGFVILHFASRHRKFDGQIALGYMAWYGLGRCMIEGLRSDSLYIGPFRVSQLLAGVSCIIAVSLLAWNHFRPQDPAKLYVNRQTEE